jgi:multidrug transporter EmrE-like cation transporter
VGGAVKASPLFVVSVTVWLGLASALLLKEAASQELHVLLLGLVLGAVLVVNAARFWLWGWVYRSHPVSITYPLGATIFPLILLVDHYRYDAALTAPKVIASLMIMIGVSVLSMEAGESRAEEAS